MTDHFEPLDSGEVISVKADTQILIGHSTFRVGELNDAIKHQLATAIEGWKEEKSHWFSQAGIECEALRFGSNGWQKGRIRLCLEFSPDDPKSAAETAESKVEPPITLVAPTSPPADHSDHPVSSATASVAEAVATPIEPAVAENIAQPIVAPANGFAATPIAVTLGTVATGAAVMAATQSQATTTTLPTPIVEVPHITDTILVPEEEQAHPLNSHEGLEEIAFDFDPENSDKQGTMVADSMMELDLSDLDFDQVDPDYLNFESGDMGSNHELHLQEVGRSENSGMLIDEVWKEIDHQRNWPGIH